MSEPMPHKNESQTDAMQDEQAPRRNPLLGMTEGLGYRAFGLFLAIAIATLSAEFIADGSIAFLVAVIGGGIAGGFFFWLADKRTGRKPPR